MLFDLGVSSPQLDVAERGFSYRRDAPLDMRMDPTVGRTGADVVNESSEDTLVELFVDNGETRFARRIARAIIAARPITTTGQLADVVREAIPAATRRTGGHPARRVFQAIRIAVNEELDQLSTGLDAALGLLRPGGRCVVISYHSGEDRLVKTTFTRAVTDDCHCPPGLPCVCGADPRFRLVHRGVTPAQRRRDPPEPPGRGARLRVVERLPNAASASPATERGGRLMAPPSTGAARRACRTPASAAHPAAAAARLPARAPAQSPSAAPAPCPRVARRRRGRGQPARRRGR